MSLTKSSIYAILEGHPSGGRYSSLFSKGICALILCNVVAVSIETLPGLSLQTIAVLDSIEMVSMAVYSFEFLLRLWACNSSGLYPGKVIGRLRYLFNPFTLIDLMVLVPYYLPFFMPIDLRMMRSLRLLRLLSMMKLGRYSEAIKTIGNVLRSKREELAITVFAIFLILVISGSLLYYAERDIQPEAFSSIPASMWWAVVTLTTVGYGDIYPVTALGKIIGSFIAILGIGLFALPAGILSSSFIEQIQNKKHKVEHCPHCGTALEQLPKKVNLKIKEDSAFEKIPI